MTTEAREIHLISRPAGTPVPENFETKTTTLADPAAGQVLIRNTVLSVDPYMRGRMNDAKSYVPPFALDAALEGGAVGVVEASGDPDVPVGTSVLHMAGWRTHALLPGSHVRPVDTEVAPDSAYVGVLGMPGLTAYAGLSRVGELKKGETVFISGAAGAVGSVAGQVARHLGAGKVIGSAGSDEKVKWLVDELGFDAAFNYHDGSVAKQLADHGPVDVYFDNVGGDHLEGAIFHMADYGRIAACGAIAGYNAEAPQPGPRNMMMIISKRLKIQGFIVSDFPEATGEFYQTFGPLVASGDLVFRETVYEGLDRTVEAFGALFTGGNTGKMIVRLD